jgi:hypothetical protein
MSVSIELHRFTLKLIFAMAGVFALMLAWPFVVSFSRLMLVGRLGWDALFWLLLGALAISSSMLAFHTMRQVVALSARQQWLRLAMMIGLALPAATVLMLFASNPP